MMKKLLSSGLLLIMILLLSGCSFAGGYYSSGKKCFVSGNYEEAASNFKKAIAKNPGRADYYIDYGLTLIALKQYENAIKQFDRVYMDKDILMIRENNKRALRGKGIAYFHMKQYKDAVVQFDEALQFNELPGLNMDILYYKGKSLITLGSYDKAREIFTVILDTYGNDAAAFGCRAFTYRMSGDYKNSQADYDQAIKMDPDCYEYYFGRYNLMTETGNMEAAEETLKKASAIEAKSSEDQYNRAKVHYYQGLYDDALKELGEGFANGFLEAYFYIGEIYAKQKDYTTAVYYYDKYINDAEVTEPVVYNQIAASLMKLNDYEKAITYLKQGIALGQTSYLKVLRRNEIVAYENLGKYDTARDKLKAYLAAYPEDKEALREIEFLDTRITEAADDNEN